MNRLLTGLKVIFLVLLGSNLVQINKVVKFIKILFSTLVLLSRAKVLIVLFLLVLLKMLPSLRKINDK